MARKRYTPEQIVSVLRQVEVLVANGKATDQACLCRFHCGVVPLLPG
jgi:hypothetical protein